MRLGPGSEEYLTQKTRHGAHTGSFTERRSSVPISEGSSAHNGEQSFQKMRDTK
jgi:hypothetical protein